MSVATDGGAKAVEASLTDRGTRLRPRRPPAKYTLAEKSGSKLLTFGASGLSVGRPVWWRALDGRSARRASIPTCLGSRNASTIDLANPSGNVRQLVGAASGSNVEHLSRLQAAGAGGTCGVVAVRLQCLGLRSILRDLRADNFPDNIIVSLSSTGVTGGPDADIAGGGVAMAVIAEGDQFGRRDRIGYRDPNVPCETFPRVRWYFGSANLGKGKTRINGSIPELLDENATASPKRKIGSPECPIGTGPP